MRRVKAPINNNNNRLGHNLRVPQARDQARTMMKTRKWR